MSSSNDTSTSSTTDTPNTSGGSGSADHDRIVTVQSLIKNEGVIPYRGLTTESDYPDDLTPVGDRFLDSGTDRPFKQAIQVLPKAGYGTLFAENEFASLAGDGEVEINVEAIRDVHGFPAEDLEDAVGKSLEQIAADASPPTRIRVDDHQDIIDRRRLALRALGFDVKFRWQIASTGYDAGDMQEFLNRKIAAAQKRGFDDAFGWISHFDWGGSARITTIYPSLKYNISQPDESDITLERGELTIANNPVEQAIEDADTDDADLDSDGEFSIYYGDRTAYDFRGTQTISAKPVIYIPSVDVTIPLPGPTFNRKHIGDVMSESHERKNDRVPLIEWHERIFSKLEDLSTQVNQNIIRARLVAIDFTDLPFEVDEFYQCLGIPASYAEDAADRATALAHPETEPTLWNLQLSLKLALLKNYSGSYGSNRFHELQELAGQILQYPAQQIQTAVEQWDLEHANDEDEDEQVLPNDQQTLAESLDDVLDIPGVNEADISAAGAQQIENRVQQRLGAADQN
ncbi:hypothetical protein SAMN05216388_100975 [Halorientalis persicus]|uniref:Uncharacterized protein n=1 Tax=Halorientalis persicus TaxID=1367881 RepID=A0A1H8MPT0_9EURY|nr:hypothetical protein [Halorientalis persicus]SEO19253.1 hypothetical protein SAMN05216388_100975 [Halorientalis persicus]